jgi:hypothetical protein
MDTTSDVRRSTLGIPIRFTLKSGGPSRSTAIGPSKPRHRESANFTVFVSSHGRHKVNPSELSYTQLDILVFPSSCLGPWMIPHALQEVIPLVTLTICYSGTITLSLTRRHVKTPIHKLIPNVSVRHRSQDFTAPCAQHGIYEISMFYLLHSAADGISGMLVALPRVATSHFKALL